MIHLLLNLFYFIFITHQKNILCEHFIISVSKEGIDFLINLSLKLTCWPCRAGEHIKRELSSPEFTMDTALKSSLSVVKTLN